MPSHQNVLSHFNRWEAAHYRLGQYADDLIQASPPFERKPAPGSRQDQSKYVQRAGFVYIQANMTLYHISVFLLNNMELCVHYFSRALRYGAKFIHQALPRMVTIWLDMGAWPDLVHLLHEVLTPGIANTAGAPPNTTR